MARQGKIERAGVEAEVLAMAKGGMGSRQIAKELKARHGLDLSHTSVNRFLTDETADRERSRRATTAAKAAEIAGKVGDDVDANLEYIGGATGVLHGMVRDGFHTIRMPNHTDDGKPLGDGLDLVIVQPLAAKDRIRAAAVLKDCAAYLVELAGANPRPIDPRNLEQVRAAIGEVFGYGAEAKGESPMEAPPTPEEHTPPVVH